jgi:acyl-CoA synthetase (AMP-forming)/AMP-acid ligase II/pimeloyl-ACP methyl ester carboxylesterase
VLSGFSLEKVFPFQRNFVTIGGYQMHYVDEGPTHGTPPVIVCLHGNPTWSFYFRELIRDLRRDFRVIAPDYIGCGLSDHPSNRHYRATERIDQVEDLLRQLGVNRYSLVMHDWGGPIGTGLAVRSIKSIERMVYFNTTLTEIESLPKIIRRAARPIIGKFLTKTTMRFLKLTTDFGVVRSLPRAIKEGYYAPYQTIARRTAIWDFVQDIPFDKKHPSYASMLEIEAQFPDLRAVPVQIIWGLRDPCFHLEMLSKIASHFPHARILEIPRASHLVLEDAPELAIATVREFFSSTSKPLASAPHRFSVASADAGHEQPASRGLYGSFREASVAVPRAPAVTLATFKKPGDRPHYKSTTFESLSTLITRYERGLTAYGLSPYDRVIVLVQPGVEFLALSYAVMGRGAVPVFIDPGIGVANILKCMKDAEPSGFLGVPRAHLLRFKARAMFAAMKFRIVATPLFVPGVTTLWNLKRFPLTPPPEVLRHPDDEAVIAFTSGATGVPKGVVFTNQMVEEQLKIFSEQFGFRATEQDCPLLPVFSLFTVALGVGSVFPPMNPGRPLSIRPDHITRILNDLGIQSSFGSPTLWTKIGEYCRSSGASLPSLKRVFMAGAPVPIQTVELLRAVMPAGETFTPYGATEALPVTLISGTDLTGIVPVPATSGEQGTLVGKPVSGVQIVIAVPSQPPCQQFSELSIYPPLVVGDIVVSGGNVSKTYINRDESNRASKVIDGDRIWHRMGDCGYLDHAGHLYFCGRRSDALTTPRGTLYSVPVETIFNAHPHVRRTALMKISAGKEPALVVEPFPHVWPKNKAAKRDFAEALRAIGRGDPITAGITKFFFHRSFPVDVRHNAKIFRDSLSLWAETQQAIYVQDTPSESAG